VIKSKYMQECALRGVRGEDMEIGHMWQGKDRCQFAAVAFMLGVRGLYAYKFYVCTPYVDIYAASQMK
jgi:hypothetical protein